MITMTDADVKYLKRATPQELLKKTNGIPWELAALIKVSIVHGHTVLAKSEELEKAWDDEAIKWQAAGDAAPSTDDIGAWLKTRSSLLYPCPECGLSKYRHPTKQGRRVTFTREHGFGLHYLCGQCCQDFDYHHNIASALALTQRWQGRCIARPPQQLAQG